MVMDTTTAAPPVTDATQAAPPATDTLPPKQPEIDWKAKAEAETARAEAAEQARKQAEIATKGLEGRIRKANEEAAATKARLDAFLEGKIQNKEEADAFDAKATAEAQVAEVKAAIQTEADRVVALKAELGIDPVTDPAFAKARLKAVRAAQAAKQGNAVLAEELLDDSRELADTAIKALRDRKAAEAAPKPETKPAAPEKPKGLSPDDIARGEKLMGLGAGTASGSIHVDKDNIDALHMQGKVTDAVYRRFLETGQL